MSWFGLAKSKLRLKFPLIGLQNDFKTAQLQVAKLFQALQRSKNGLALLLEGWSEYESSLQQLEISRNSLSNLTQTSTILTEEHRLLVEQLTAADIKIAECRRNRQQHWLGSIE